MASSWRHQSLHETQTEALTNRAWCCACAPNDIGKVKMNICTHVQTSLVRVLDLYLYMMTKKSLRERSGPVINYMRLEQIFSKIKKFLEVKLR